MHIVIDIPEEVYEEIINSEDCGLHELTRAIANGVPLSKGHGALIDKHNLIGKIHGVRSITAVLDAPIIIAADKDSEE